MIYRIKMAKNCDGATLVIWTLFILTQIVNCQHYANSAILLNCSIPLHNHPVLSASWDSNSTHFFLELTGQTLGWMAFGISKSGQMDMSDIMFGWCDDESVNEVDNRTISAMPCYAQDRFIQVERLAERADLLSEPSQDWHMIWGSQNGTHTSIRAVRRLQTSDNFRDYPITRQINAIYAVGGSDPDISTGEVLKHAYRGSRMLTVLPDLPDSLDSQGSIPVASADQSLIWTGLTAPSSEVHSSAEAGSSHINVPFPIASSSISDLNLRVPDESLIDQTTLLQLIVKTLHGLAGLLNFLSLSKPTTIQESPSMPSSSRSH